MAFPVTQSVGPDPWKRCLALWDARQDKRQHTPDLIKLKANSL